MDRQTMSIIPLHKNGRWWIAAAALSGGIAVVAGAFAAHALDPIADAKPIEYLRIGSLYETVHALAILAVMALSAIGLLNARLAAVTRWLFLAGAVIFPGALYILALGGPRWLGAIAPIGGIAFILGWVTLAIAAFSPHGAREGT